MEKRAHFGPAKPIGPYSPAIEVNGFLFVSGQIPLKEDGSLLSGDVGAQAELVLENIKRLLEQAGCSLTQVVKTTIYLSDMQDFSIVNNVYSRYFEEPYPARTTVQVAALPRGAKIEIEVVAFKGR
ncbi:MAG: Rid family detoxifying hydrolase [Coprothermobacterota bacterium]|jgi:2-iminobutanoate/2-iminopropanoate deaminase|nr:Rid family detoxifying hydrolase [Coprothermobacterota bacterium]